jgi:hypothetical protein
MSEKYLGEVSTPLLINQIKENCAQKRTALPIPSVDELGHIYQYMGVTSGSLVHGYFYECVSDGQDPATYSWQQVNVQPTAGIPTAATTTFDNTTSGLQATNVQGAIDEVVGGLGTAASKGFTPNVAPNNHNLVESNAVYNAITTALTSIYTPRGDLTCAELTSSLLVAANVGNIYEMSDSGTTSALFLQGAGKTIHVGDNVGIIQTGVDTYKFNLMANAFDMTDYQKKELTSAVEGQSTVEGALSTLNTKEKDDVKNVYEVIGQNGAKNLLPIKYSEITNYGITWKKLNDGSVIMNGTSTAAPAQQSIFDTIPSTISSTYGTLISLKELGIDGTKKYIFSRDTKISNVRPRIDLWSDSAKLLEVELSNDDGLYKEIDFSQYPTCIGLKATIQITLNTTVTNAIQKLMLCSKEWYDGDPTYQPYAMTNKQITNAMPLNVGASNKLVPSLSRIITPTESTANPDLLNTLTGGNVKFAWGAIKLQNDAPHTIDNEVYVISYAEANISQVGNTAVIAQIAIARSGSGYDSSIYKRFYCYHGGTYKWSPWEKLATESDIAITTLGTQSEVFSSVESGYTINDLAMYKQGKHVWGTFVLSKDSGDLPSSQAAVATLKFIPSASMNSWCACSGNRYGGQPFYIGYMWAASGNGQILVCNPSGTTSGVNTAKIMLDYCID